MGFDPVHGLVGGVLDGAGSAAVELDSQVGVGDVDGADLAGVAPAEGELLPGDDYHSRCCRHRIR